MSWYRNVCQEAVEGCQRVLIDWAGVTASHDQVVSITSKCTTLHYNLNERYEPRDFVFGLTEEDRELLLDALATHVIGTSGGWRNSIQDKATHNAALHEAVRVGRIVGFEP